jgi:sec-independent protein translocase protein TatA
MEIYKDFNMGIAGVSPGSLLLVFLIILMVFGTKRLRSIGEDLGAAVRSFRKGLEQHDDQ